MRGHRPSSTQVLLKNLIARCKVDDSGCVLVQRNKQKSGYGLVKRRGGRLYAHRFVWSAINGTIPDGIDVLHKCDNPSCVNIEHLYLGNDRQNNIDRSLRGRVRGFYGDQKLFVQDVLEIRRRFALGGITLTDLAKEYGVTQQYLGGVISRKYWNYV